MNVLMLFLDGVGIGEADPRKNPFAAGCAPLFSSITSDGAAIDREIAARRTVIPLDATLGIEGLPQSGTGQATLFTGVNASRVLGRHFGPYPHSSLHPMLRERNIFRQLTDLGIPVCFANAFPSRFFDYARSHPGRLSATTLCCTMSGVPLLGFEDLLAGNALSADITGSGWAELGYPQIPVIAPEAAGEQLLRLTSDSRFVLFEYWKTDHAGHSMDGAMAREVLSSFDRMLSGILEAMDDNTLVLITSDHGNIEDLTTKVHTTNPVPLVLCGAGHAQMAELLRRHGGTDLSSVTPSIVDYLSDAS